MSQGTRVNRSLDAEVRRRRRVSWALTLAMLGAGACARANPDPPEARTLHWSDAVHRLALRPTDGTAPIGPLHAWQLVVESAKGAPVAGAKVAVDGGMRAHGHGLPTQPQVIETERPGIYRMEGVQFTMQGDWTFVLTVTSAAGRSVAEIDFDVSY